MRRLCVILYAALALAFNCLAGVPAFPDQPQPQRLVNDFASVFTAGQIEQLESRLVAFDDSTSNQICLVTVADLYGYDVAEYALRLANKWGIGSSRNNGVIVLLKPRGTDRYIDVTIQVGRGLEGAITDAYASRIIRNIMGPCLREDRYFDAVDAATAELMALASREISEPRDRSVVEDAADVAGMIFGIFVIIFLIVIILSALSNSSGSGGSGGGPTINSGPPFRGFGGYGGGSFGGFGGGSSSGGFGGGFGGFGGGSFGGGGASGRF